MGYFAKVHFRAKRNWNYQISRKVLRRPIYCIQDIFNIFNFVHIFQSISLPDPFSVCTLLVDVSSCWCEQFICESKAYCGSYCLGERYTAKHTALSFSLRRQKADCWRKKHLTCWLPCVCVRLPEVHLSQYVTGEVITERSYAGKVAVGWSIKRNCWTSRALTVRYKKDKTDFVAFFCFTCYLIKVRRVQVLVDTGASSA